MKRIFWVVFGVAAIGAANRGFSVPEEADAPDLASESAQTQDSVNPWSLDAADEPASNKVALSDRSQSSWSGGEVALKRQRDGHFYANITVESRDLQVLVDTGASIIALTGDDARDLGLHWDDSQVRPIGRGASGDVYGVPVMLDQVTLQGIEASEVQAVIVPKGLDVTLLGQSFLSQVDKVEISGDKMVLTD